ncbi:hypothetical protein LCGC14_1386820 [marine sediment metagenome]|uniref:Uncharacterized protein n=1 Tax=marine sediment metagenome TaxID=412755 RepID=A0A0F9MGM6_9ZZZZ
MPGRKLDAGAIWDHLERECPGQTMTRENFIKEVGELTCPHRKAQDLARMTMERDKQRTLGLYSKAAIDRSLSNG